MMTEIACYTSTSATCSVTSSTVGSISPEGRWSFLPAAALAKLNEGRTFGAMFAGNFGDKGLGEEGLGEEGLGEEGETAVAASRSRGTPR